MDAADKGKTYNESVPFDVKCGKIDFFISHSWNDDAKWKRTALDKFCEHFKEKNGRYPTFWFDKVRRTNILMFSLKMTFFFLV